MKTILLGAGASYGASRNGGTRCPLVNEILPTAAKLGLLNPTYAAASDAQFENELTRRGVDLERAARITGMQRADHLHILRRFLFEQFGLNEDDLATARIDFERLFELIQANLLGHHGLMRLRGEIPERAAPADVLEMQFMLVLCGAIIASIRDLRCEFHDALAQWLAPSDLVVSFNYDLLIDRSLKARGDWFLDDGYGLSFHRLGRRNGDEILWRKPRNRRSGVTLLKPHGSLNWLYARDSWNTVMHRDLHIRGRNVPAKLFCLDDMNARFEADHPLYEWWERFDFEYRGYTFDLHSVLIPPTVSKPYRAFEELVGDLWAKLLVALLTTTTELYIIGYSLRPDDARTWWLFKKVAAESETLKRIVVIDPSDETYVRAKSAFEGRTVERGAATLADFISDLRSSGDLQPTI